MKYLLALFIFATSLSASPKTLNLEKVGQFVCLNWLVWVYQDFDADFRFIPDGILIPVETINRVGYRLTPEGIECTVDEYEEVVEN